MNVVLKQLQKVLGRPGDSGVSDTELLGRYLGARDQAAFELLVWRYHRMVLGVCRRTLADPADVEDAFQATFLVLARRAGAIRRRASLSSWLYGVARRVAREAAGRNARRRREPPGEVPAGEDPADAAGREELRRLLDEELGRLPEKYRSPLVLCHLEGATYDEAAQRLGWPKGTVSTRLARARDLLRARLVRRGVTLPAGLLAGWLAADTAAGAPAALVIATVRAATGAAACAARVASLTEKAVRAMFLTRVKVGAALALALALLGAAGGGLAYRAAAGDDPPAPAARPPAPADEPAADKKPSRGDREALQGTWLIESFDKPDGTRETEKELDGRGWVIKGDRITFHNSRNTMGGTFSFTLDPSAKPKTIDVAFPASMIRGPNRTGLGIYKLEGDRLTVATSSEKRPTEFKADKESKTSVYVFRRGELPEFTATRAFKALNEERRRLAGTWEQVSFTQDGAEVPLPNSGKARLTITGIDTRFTVEVGSLPVSPVVSSALLPLRRGTGQFIFGPTSTPKWVAVYHDVGPAGPAPAPGGPPGRGLPWTGTYELDGDTLRLCLAPPGKERATKLESKPGSGLSLEVWKRVKE
jgi:RNA polymerase sigma factor (sigma-70 family)